MRFSPDEKSGFQWVENLWKKESIEKHKCIIYFFVNTKMDSFFIGFELIKKKTPFKNDQICFCCYLVTS